MSRLRYPFTEISARCRLCGAEGLTASSEHALGGRLIDWRRSHAPVCPEWPRWAEKKGLRLDERGALLYPNETGPYAPRIRPKSEGDGDGDESLDADGAEPVESLVPDGAETKATRVPDGDEVPRPRAAKTVPADPSLTTVANEPQAPAASGRTPVPVDPAPVIALAPLDHGGDPPRSRTDAPSEDARPRALWLVGDEAPEGAGADAELETGGSDDEDSAPLPIPLPVAGATPRAPRHAAARGGRAARPAHPEVDLMEVPIERLRQAELF